MSNGPKGVHFGKEGKIGKADVVRQIPTFSVKYVDVFNLKNLYVMMHEMLLEEEWLGFEESDEGMSAHNDIEVLYSENVFQKGIHKGGKEYWIWWRFKKQWERRNEYFLNTLDIDWHVVGSSDIELIHQGKKLKAVKAEIEIFFTGRLLSDVGQRWEDHSLLRHFKPFYEQRIMHANIEKREKELWRDIYRISSKLKAYLKLKTWMKATPQFHAPIHGWQGEF